MFNDFFIGVSSLTASTDPKLVVFTLMRIHSHSNLPTEFKVIFYGLGILGFFVLLLQYWSDPEETNKELEKTMKRNMERSKKREKSWKYWVAEAIIRLIITAIVILFFAYKVLDYLFGWLH
ncbi:MAG: hypothetical protein K5979_00420 [Ruminococcus sp.]|nr:hypothetical protein [Ruminococcus sp.]